MYWLLRGTFPILFNRKISGLVKVSENQKYILVANHQSHLDPFLIFTSLPYEVFKKLRPAAFMTKNKYTDRSWKRFFTAPLGMFPAHSNQNYPAGIEMASRLVDQGFTLVMFPEGKIGRDREHAPHKGAVVIAVSKKLSLLPARISWAHSILRSRVSLTYGSHFQLSNVENYDVAAKQLMNNIYSLKLSNKKTELEPTGPSS